jgi:hypothetical protein
MPYIIASVPGGFKVKKEGTQKTFSKRPLKKPVAEAQMRALYAAERKSTK